MVRMHHVEEFGQRRGQPAGHGQPQGKIAAVEILDGRDADHPCSSAGVPGNWGATTSTRCPTAPILGRKRLHRPGHSAQVRRKRIGEHQDVHATIP